MRPALRSQIVRVRSLFTEVKAVVGGAKANQRFAAIQVFLELRRGLLREVFGSGKHDEQIRALQQIKTGETFFHAAVDIALTIQ